MTVRTVQIYEVANGYIQNGGTATILNTYYMTINDDDGTLQATPGTDTGTPTHISGGFGEASSYNFIYNDRIRFGNTNLNVKTFQLTINGVVHTFIMNSTGGSIPGMTTGSSFRLQSFSTYTALAYSSVPCFAAGTLILTDFGEMPVEKLTEGTMVITRDHGPQPIRWIGRADVTHRAILTNPNLRPVILRKDCLGPGLPCRDLRLSPQHRVLLSGWLVELQHGAEEVLAPAKHLVGRTGIEWDFESESVSYYHLLLDRHEIIESEGLPTETFLLGETIRAGLDDAQGAEIAALFPDLAVIPDSRRPARQILRGHEVAAMMPLAA